MDLMRVAVVLALAATAGSAVQAIDTPGQQTDDVLVRERVINNSRAIPESRTDWAQARQTDNDTNPSHRLFDKQAPKRPAPVVSAPAIRGVGCGNSAPDAGETCDDGNTAAGDGCSATCQVESGFSCTAAIAGTETNILPNPGFGNPPGGAPWVQSGTPRDPLCMGPMCPFPVSDNNGDGWVYMAGGAFGENATTSASQSIFLSSIATTLFIDVREASCAPNGGTNDYVSVEIDGNEIFNSGTCNTQGSYFRYQVDLATANGGPYNDDASHVVDVKGSMSLDGFGQTGSIAVDNVRIIELTPAVPSVCTSPCGNAELDPGETCDDGNAAGGDGCSSTCLVETGSDCTLPVPAGQPVINGSFEDPDFPPWVPSDPESFQIGDLLSPFGDIGQIGEQYMYIFGSGGMPAIATIEQADITIPSTATTLSWEFFGSSPAVNCDNDNAVFRARLDGTVIFDSSGTPADECDTGGGLWDFPQAVLIDGSGAAPDFADGGLHTLTFEREIIQATLANTNFFIDDVQIDVITAPLIPSACYIGVCGDSILSIGEVCDDGNTAGGDGCSATCDVVEEAFDCTRAEDVFDVLASSLSFEDDISDGGFEGEYPNTSWVETGTIFSPICSEALCGFANQRVGAFFAWFGGSLNPHIQTLSQSGVSISPDATTLEFELLVDVCDSADDNLTVEIDGNEVYRYDCTSDTEDYETQSIDLATATGGPYNDGLAHTIAFIGNTIAKNGGNSDFFVDDIRIEYPVSPDRPANASSCSMLNDACGPITTFESGIIPAGWTLIETGQNGSDWGTTDDGVCGSGNWSGGNTTGASGEAACIDSDAAGLGSITEAYLCTPALDLSTTVGAALSFRVNYQTARQQICPLGECTVEFLEFVAGTVQPNALTVPSQNYEVVGNILDHTSNTLSLSPPQAAAVDLSGYDGESAVWVCAHYGGEFSWYAQLDDMALRADNCNTTSDADADGVLDNSDNCTLVFNPDQRDDNGDGFGNLCDGDLDGSCFTGFPDLQFFAQVFGSNLIFTGADFDGSGFIGFPDLAIFADLFGTVPGPSAQTNVCTAP